jgi:hypothetical protein
LNGEGVLTVITVKLSEITVISQHVNRRKTWPAFDHSRRLPSSHLWRRRAHKAARKCPALGEGRFVVSFSAAALAELTSPIPCPLSALSALAPRREIRTGGGHEEIDRLVLSQGAEATEKTYPCRESKSLHEEVLE